MCKIIILLIFYLIFPNYLYAEELKKNSNSENQSEKDNSITNKSDSVFKKMKIESGEIIVSSNSLEKENAAENQKENEKIENSSQ
ncbi:hypothetical protein [Fluviispira vulneris]|uniref:hypothetical protein n=1 Tax=Fluviispira vulneris TaxID=2763012 RepID=UPI001649035A|nr:hypothetical protein [Fluviispira vulneris]